MQRSLNAERGMNRPPGRVLVCDRRAEQRHQPVTAVLVNSAFETVNLGCDQFEAVPHNLMDIFRIELLGHSGKSGNIAEQYRDLAALALPWGVSGPNFLRQMVGQLESLSSGREIYGLHRLRRLLRTWVRRWRRKCFQGLPAGHAEPVTRPDGRAATRTTRFHRDSALRAESCSRRVLGSTG